MLRTKRLLLCTLLLSICIIFIIVLSSSPAYALAPPKAELTLNIQQGPLGVTLSLKGKNLHPGQASLSYTDAQGIPGTFVTPSDTSVQVQANGTFSTTNVILPTIGPVGIWKILVTDSLGTVWPVNYTVLAVPGAQEASVPSLMVNPTSGKSGDIIAFTGSNWLPEKTIVNLTLLIGTTSVSLLDASPVSDKNGAVTGAFHLPANLNVSQVLVVATDATKALQAETQVIIVNASATPSASPTIASSPTATPLPISESTATTTAQTGLPGSDNTGTGGPLTLTQELTWGWALLVVGSMVGAVAIVLIVVLIPWSERRGNTRQSRQY